MQTNILPIDALLPEIVRAPRNLVIEAAPGAGKTTRVPPALLKHGDVLVLEPRRIAARMAARRVAFEMGERVGETVGYQVRFEEIAGPKTRLRFVTEGVLTRKLLSDPELRGVATVVLDEFHERHLDTDLALALLRRLQTARRPDLRIVVMSATLDSEPVVSFLGNCGVVRSEGRLFPLEIKHLPYSPAPLEEQIAGALPKLATTGDVLAFLPGAAEIRRAMRACASFPGVVCPLYGDLSPEEQDRAVSPANRRKLVLATNIAESSITIDGVTAVIDSGLARVARDSPWTGMPVLEVKRVSKASAQQRAGRAGRTAPGEVIRLYTAEDFHRRPQQEAPEILRRELSGMCLQLRAMGVRDPRELEWLDAPPDATVDAAEELLDRLHSAPEDAKLPLHPRLARLVMNARSDEGCAAAALLSSGERVSSNDLLKAVDAPLEGNARSVYQQIRRSVPRAKGMPLPMAVLSAFPDRVGRRKAGGQVQLAMGGAAEMKDPPGNYLVAADIEERSDRPLPLVRLASAIEPEWLIDLFPERIRERNTVEWNRDAERVDAVSALLYDELVLEESRSGAPDPELAASTLAERLDPGQFEEFLARVDFASRYAEMPAIDLPEALRKACYGLRSLAEAREISLEAVVDMRLLNEIAPDRLRLPSGRFAKVHYERGRPPWVASRLQDFFGMKETPRVARGAAPVVVHLLAPNHRPVQMTTDLAGFWERLYPQLRRELGRRYPKHAWPERPV